MKQRIACLLLTAGLVLFSAGCTSSGGTSSTQTADTTNAEDLEASSMAAEQVRVYLQQARSLFARQKVQIVDGVQITSGTVERVGGSIDYTPAAGSGCFTINGKLTDNSEIALSINPVGVLRYKLSLHADADKTVRAEIRAYKQEELLSAYEQDGLQLHAGENTIDACIDTGENQPCRGVYCLRFYIDGKLAAETEYEP